MTREEMLKDLEYLVTEGELEYFETLSVEDLKRRHENFFDNLENSMFGAPSDYDSVSVKELANEYWDKLTKWFNCDHCPPNKGENRTNWKKHGTHKPKYKNKRI